MVPSLGARSSFCIFIASTTSSCWPAETASPGATDDGHDLARDDRPDLQRPARVAGRPAPGRPLPERGPPLGLDLHLEPEPVDEDLADHRARGRPPRAVPGRRASCRPRPRARGVRRPGRAAWRPRARRRRRPVFAQGQPPDAWGRRRGRDAVASRTRTSGPAGDAARVVGAMPAGADATGRGLDGAAALRTGAVVSSPGSTGRDVSRAIGRPSAARPSRRQPSPGIGVAAGAPSDASPASTAAAPPVPTSPEPSPLDAASPAASSALRDGRRGARPRRPSAASTQPVDRSAARNASLLATNRWNGSVVWTPPISVSSSARRRRSIAASRSGAVDHAASR